MTRIPDNRIIELEGAYNFRDIGGYTTSEGRQTCWRRLFRSDNLAKLTKDDLQRIDRLNLQLIVDLRSEQERDSRPNRLPPGNGIKTRHIEIADITKSHNDLQKEIFYGKLGRLDLEKELLKSYRRGIVTFRSELRMFFELLLNPANYPALVLCNAGKDRTGVVIALTLLALGVPRKTVMQDYMLSKVRLKPAISRMITKVRWLSLFRADIGQLKNLLDTRAEYLNATFGAIDGMFGSTEAFFDDVGMDQDRRKRLETILCDEHVQL